MGRVKSTKPRNNWTTLKTNWIKVKSTKLKENSKNFEEPLLMTLLTLLVSEKNGKKCRTLPWRHSVKPTKRTQLLTLMEPRKKQKTLSILLGPFFFFKLFYNLLIYDK